MGEETDCVDYLNKWYKFVGRTEKGINVFGLAQIASLVLTYAHILYKSIVEDDNQLVVHFATLTYFYLGVMWTVQIKRPQLMALARQCDSFVGLASDEYKSEYRRIKASMRMSKLDFGSNYSSVQVYGIAFYMAARPLLLYWFRGEELELVLTGRDSDPIKFWLMYLSQAWYMATAGLVVATSTKLHTRICLHMYCKYKLLYSALASLRLDPTRPREEQIPQIDAKIKQCAIHYQHILSIFNEFKKVAGYSFIFIYFGLLGSITISRKSLTGDNPNYGVFPDFVAEISYIFYIFLVLTDVVVVILLYHYGYVHAVKQETIHSTKTERPPSTKQHQNGAD